MRSLFTSPKLWLKAGIGPNLEDGPDAGKQGFAERMKAIETRAERIVSAMFAAAAAGGAATGLQILVVAIVNGLAGDGAFEADSAVEYGGLSLAFAVFSAFYACLGFGAG